MVNGRHLRFLAWLFLLGFVSTAFLIYVLWKGPATGRFTGAREFQSGENRCLRLFNPWIQTGNRHEFERTAKDSQDTNASHFLSESKTGNFDGYRCILENRTLSMKCDTCALVSSSGQICGQNKGSEIDRTDCVFRMNAAPVKGFEMDVGQKTSARIVAFNAFGLSLKAWNQGMKFIVWTNNRPQDIKHVVLYAKSNKNRDICMSTKEYIQRMDKLFEEETNHSRYASHTWLSTGWFAFDLLRHMCSSTRIYGMIPPDFCKKKNQPRGPYHYWDKTGDECDVYLSNEKSATGSHRFLSEKIIFARWAVASNMSFHTPEWDPKDYTNTRVTQFV